MRCFLNLSVYRVKLSWSLAEKTSTEGMSLTALPSAKKSSSWSAFLYDVTEVGFAHGFASSRIACAFDPPKPKELTLALRNGTFGHGVDVLLARSLSFSKSTGLR